MPMWAAYLIARWYEYRADAALRRSADALRDHAHFRVRAAEIFQRAGLCE